MLSKGVAMGIRGVPSPSTKSFIRGMRVLDLSKQKPGKTVATYFRVAEPGAVRFCMGFAVQALALQSSASKHPPNTPSEAAIQGPMGPLPPRWACPGTEANFAAFG